MKAISNRLYRTLRSLSGYLDRVGSQDFFSDVADVCLDSYKVFIQYIIENFALLEESSHESTYLFFVERFIPQLRYVERSSTRNIPWSIVPFLNGLLRAELGPEYLLLIRPQWHFNYSVITTDLIQTLKQILGVLFPTKRGTFDTLFPNKRVHIFTFPYFERTNVLLHSVIGHEIGHFFHDQWLMSPEGQRRIEATRTALSAHYGKAAPSDLFVGYDKATSGAKIIEGMYREIFSDIAGYMVFGPSMLFVLDHLVIFEKKATLPSEENNYYPLTRYRVRILYERLYKADEKVQRLKADGGSFAEWLAVKESEILDTLSSYEDTTLYSSLTKERELFEESIAEFVDFARSKVKADYFNPDRAADMFKNLENDLPINEIEGKPVNMVNILFTGWIFYTKLMRQKDGEEFVLGYQILSRLLLKSIYSSFIHEGYLAHKRRGA